MKNSKCCIGCGVKLQSDNLDNLGYVDDLSKNYCMRCYKLINYGVYENVNEKNIDYKKIFKEINDTQALVLYIIDILNIPSNIENIKKYIKNNWILVLNKRDLLPLSVKEEKIKKYFNDLDLGYLDIEVISTKKNTNMDQLMEIIRKHKKSKDIYVVGYTNAGKSSLINKIIKNYSDKETNLTISPLPSTTLDSIKIKISDDLNIIDTPGFIDNGNIINYVDSKEYKKLNSKKEIKPKTFRIKKGECLIINNILRINYLSFNDNSFTFYIPNDFLVKRVSIKNDILTNINKKIINVDANNDLVVSGLGFIKMVNKCRIEVFIDEKIAIFTRNNLI